MDPKLNVYIWDMDETLILLKSLINGTFAESFNGSKDVQQGIHIGKTWENQILQICDHYFFYQQIESCNKPFLDALCQYDDGQDLTDYDFSNDGFVPLDDDVNRRKLAYRHRAIADKYNKGLRNVFDKDTIKSWDNLYEATDTYTDKWFSSARTCLEQCSSQNNDSNPSVRTGVVVADPANSGFQHVHVLVTSGSLIPSLVKCLLFRLDSLITCDNVYSSWDVGKQQCFRWIRERFSGSNVQFCAIGDGWEECEAAETMQWPFVQIDPRPGSPHRFPGLTVETLRYYLAVIYGNSDEEIE